MIKKIGNQYRVVSEKTNRNMGTYPTKKGAAKKAGPDRDVQKLKGEKRKMRYKRKIGYRTEKEIKREKEEREWRHFKRVETLIKVAKAGEKLIPKVKDSSSKSNSFLLQYSRRLRK